MTRHGLGLIPQKIFLVLETHGADVVTPRNGKSLPLMGSLAGHVPYSAQKARPYKETRTYTEILLFK